MKTNRFDHSEVAGFGCDHAMWSGRNPLIHQLVAEIRDGWARHTCEFNSVFRAYICNACVRVTPIHTHTHIVVHVVKGSNPYGDKGLRTGLFRDASKVVSQRGGRTVR